MTRDHLTAASAPRRPSSSAQHGGWGYGMAAPGPLARRPAGAVGLRLERRHRAPCGPRDPDYGLTGIVLSTRAMTSPEPPAHMVDFWQAAYGALAG